VCLCYLSNRSIRLQIHRHLKWKTIEKQSKQIQEQKNLIRSSPYPSRTTSPVQLSVVAFFYCVLKQRITMKELNVSLLKRNLLGKVVLGFPKPLDYTDYFPYQLCDLLVYNGESPMWCSVRIDPLWDGLNPSSSLVFDAAFGQLGPLSSILLLLHCLSSLCSSFLCSVLLSRFWWLFFCFSCAWL